MTFTLCGHTPIVSTARSHPHNFCLWIACLVFQLITVGMPLLTVANDEINCPSEFPPHPRLFTNPDELKKLKQFIQENPEAKNFVASLITRVETEQENIPLPPAQPDDMENRPISTLARDLAIAYALTGNQRYATASAEILKSYAEVYPGYEVTVTKGKAMPSTLNEARWAIDLATAYDLIYQSPALSKSDKQRIESDIFIPCGEVLRICNHKTRSNWRARAIAGLGVVGFCIGNCDFIDEAINGFRNNDNQIIRNGFIQHLGYSILGDGIFYERSFGYQAYTTDSYFLLLEAARHSGIDLWNHRVSADSRDAGSDVERTFGPAGRKSVKAVFDALFYRSFSDGAVTNVANASADFFLPRRYYEAAWRAWNDPKYAFAARLDESDRRPWDGLSNDKITRIRDAADLLWIDPSLPRGDFSLAQDATIGNTGIHRNGCTLFPNGGYAILRQSTAVDAVCAEMNFGCWGSGHSHPDKLSIVISDGHRKVIREARYFGYGDRSHLTWDLQTVAHNTVTVDRTSQHPQRDKENAWPVPKPGTIVRGQPLIFFPGKRLKVFRAECTDAYPGVRLERTIAMVDSVVYDFYKTESDTSHTYDFTLHIDAPLMAECDKVTLKSINPLSNEFGYRHVEIDKRGVTPLTVDLGYGRKINFLTPSEVYMGKGISGKGKAGMPIIMLHHEGRHALFIAAYTMKPNNLAAPSLVSSGNRQSIKIGNDLLLVNSQSHVALRDLNGRLIEIAK